MFEVSTKDELKRALIHNEDDIYVVNKKLSVKQHLFCKFPATIIQSPC